MCLLDEDDWLEKVMEEDRQEAMRKIRMDVKPHILELFTELLAYQCDVGDKTALKLADRMEVNMQELIALTGNKDEYWRCIKDDNL